MLTKQQYSLINITPDFLITVSLYIFVVLYNIPVTIILPGIIRKPLLLLGVGCFFLGMLMLGKVKYVLMFMGAVAAEMLYHYLSWSIKLSFTSYMFPAIISVEFLICALMLLDGEIKIHESFLKFFIIVTLLTSLTTIIGLIEYPTAIRTLGQVSDDVNSYWQNLYRTRNIAGWGLLFGMSFATGTMYYVYKNTRSKLAVIALIFTSLAVVMSQLMFAIILMAIGIFLVFVNGSGRTIIIKSLPFMVAFLVFWVFRAQILTALYEMFQDTDLQMLSLRFKNLYDLLVMRDTTGDAGARFELYLMSINTFLNHPIFGRMLIGDTDVMLEIGFHSELFDLLGTLGIVGITLVVYVILILFKRIIRICSYQDRRFYFSMCILLIIMFIINPIIPYPHMWMSTLLIPVLAFRESVSGAYKEQLNDRKESN